MNIIHTFECAGENGGKWYCASYPLGATRYYTTPDARTKAITAYVQAIEATGGYVLTIEA